MKQRGIREREERERNRQTQRETERQSQKERQTDGHRESSPFPRSARRSDLLPSQQPNYGVPQGILLGLQSQCNWKTKQQKRSNWGLQLGSQCLNFTTQDTSQHHHNAGAGTSKDKTKRKGLWQTCLCQAPGVFFLPWNNGKTKSLRQSILL